MIVHERHPLYFINKRVTIRTNIFIGVKHRLLSARRNDMISVINAKTEDTERIVNLAVENSVYFPGLCLEDFRQNLSCFIERKEALVAKMSSEVVGVLLFSKSEKELCFIAVKSTFRRKGVAELLFEKMSEHFSSGNEIKVVTFRDGDKKGTAALAFYRKIGFTFKEEMAAFGYPCQILTKVI